MTSSKPRIDRMPLRQEGSVTVDAEAVRLYRPDTEIVIPGDRIQQVTLEPVKWGLAVISALTVGFGIYFAAVGSVLGGTAVAALGVWSLYRVYVNRYALILWVDGRGEVQCYPERPKACHAAIAAILRD